MKSLILAILSILLNKALYAFEPHTANYQLSINGIKIAEEVRTLHKLEDKYFYTANAKTSGLAALVKDYSISASSTFTIKEKGVDSINYQIIEQEDKKVTDNYAVDINSSNGIVSSILTKSQPKVVKWNTEKSNIVDPLSIFLAISFDLANSSDESEFNYQIADGKSIEQQKFKKTENQVIKINNKEFNTIKVELINSNDNDIQAYFLSEYRYLPILIKRTKSGRDYVYEINNFKISEIEKLQVTL